MADTTSSQPPAIVVSKAAQGLAVTRALGEQGIRVVVLHWTDHDVARLSRHADEVVKVPQPERDGDAFVEALLGLAPRLHGAVVIPTSDEAVRDLARSKPELSRHFIVACPDADVSERFIDKRHTYELAAERGIAIPRTLVPTSIADLDRFHERVMYPCLVKPRESHRWVWRFDGKMAVVHDLAAMRAVYSDAVDAGVDVLIQELIPGGDACGVNYNAYRAGGEVVAECTARKVRQAPPGFGLPRVVRSVEVPEVVEPGRAILEALGFEGFACTEFKYDARDRTFKLLEVNGRHNLSTLLSVRSGLNFPWISYRHLTTGELPPAPRQRTGLYWIDETMDIPQSFTKAGRDGRPLREILRPWFRDHVFAVYDGDDRAPLLEGGARRVASAIRARTPLRREASAEP
jgi:predicted ATP-grasp superfamily ATP-dependent carboligase